MKQHIEKILGTKITEEQYQDIRSLYDTQQGMYILTINDGKTNLRKGIRVNTNNWLEVQEQVKLEYPDGYIEGFSVMTN